MPVPKYAASAMLTALTACGPSPEALVRRVEQAVQSRDWAAVARDLDADYTDPLGDRGRLLADLKALDRNAPRWTIAWTSEGLRAETSALVSTVETRLEAELNASPRWKIEGPMALSLHRSDRWRIRGGLLTDLRDIRGLMQARRAALEANDADALGALLHPSYRDGLIDRDEAEERLRRDLDGVVIRFRPTHYRLEVRRDLAHIDEHYVMTVDGRPGRPAVAGLTLRRTAGRWRIAGGLYRKDAP